MRQKVEIHVSGSADPKQQVLRCRNLRIGQWLLAKLFGSEGRLMVLVPSGNVSSVCITDDRNGGSNE